MIVRSSVEMHTASSIPWIASYPRDWVVRPLLDCVDEVRSRNQDNDEGNVLSLSYGRIVNRDVESNFGLLPESFSTYNCVQPDDIVMRLTDLQNDQRSLRVGLVRDQGIVTSAYVALRPRRSVHPGYMYYLLHAYDLCKVYYTLGSGLRQTMRFADLKRLPVLCPSWVEQTAIAAFLDRQTAQIDALLATHERLLALLEEQRQAVMTRAVTQGLDPAVPMKDTGIPWLGKVPAHWDVVPIRRVATEWCDGPFGSGLKSSHYTSSGVRVVRLQNIGSGVFLDDDSAFIDPDYYGTLGDHSVKPGDVLVAGLGDENHPAGRACVAPAGLDSAMVKADCFRFRLDRAFAEPEYIAQHLSATAVPASAYLATGATRQRVNLQSAAARLICVPPAHEQQYIVDYLAVRTEHADRVIQSIRRVIGLFGEYRSALITAAVTGQIDVREEGGAALAEG